MVEMNVVTVGALYCYPIKSCRGISLDVATVLATGLLQDRRWMLVNEQGKFITQRDIPKIALIVPALLESGLCINAPNMPTLEVRGTSTACPVKVMVWKDVCPAFDEGQDAAGWFSEFIGVPLRLVRFDDDFVRLSGRDWTADIDAPNQFSDGFPFLAIGSASLHDLNSRMAVPLPMDRFRPNLVLYGLEPYAEDNIDTLTSDALSLQAVKPCTRCKVTTVDQSTGLILSTEPFSTLMKYRRHAALRGVTFGQNMILRAGVGSMLKVGQSLQVNYRA